MICSVRLGNYVYVPLVSGGRVDRSQRGQAEGDGPLQQIGTHEHFFIVFYRRNILGLAVLCQIWRYRSSAERITCLSMVVPEDNKNKLMTECGVLLLKDTRNSESAF